MNKVGRNEPCPCGSGKKFKRCCGTDMPEQKLSADSAIPPDVRDVTLSVMGLPAQSGALHVINQFKEGDPRNNALPQGVPGNYQVTFVLARPGYSLLPEGKFSFATDSREIHISRLLGQPSLLRIIPVLIGSISTAERKTVILPLRQAWLPWQAAIISFHYK
jgi:SEC-C motif-containing protein